MEKLEEQLRALREQPAQMLLIQVIHQRPEYQPRSLSVVPVSDRARLETDTERHIGRLRGTLAADADHQLDPILVAEVNGDHCIVDGHHRYEAYRQAKRSLIPARVLALSRRDAVLVAKRVNTDGTKLPLHPEQAREAAWQYLAAVTARGRLQQLPKGLSYRTVAALFGLGNAHDTIGRMMKKLPSVNLGDYGPSACDLGTGWPHWKAVKGNAFRDAYGDTSLEARERQKAEKIAIWLLGKLSKESPSVRRLVAEVIRRDAADAHAAIQADALDEWNGIPVDY